MKCLENSVCFDAFKLSGKTWFLHSHRLLLRFTVENTSWSQPRNVVFLGVWPSGMAGCLRVTWGFLCDVVAGYMDAVCPRWSYLALLLVLFYYSMYTSVYHQLRIKFLFKKLECLKLKTAAHLLRWINCRAKESVLRRIVFFKREISLYPGKRFWPFFFLSSI